MNTINTQDRAVERLKVVLLDELNLFTEKDWSAWWRQSPWPKPHPASLAGANADLRQASPLAFALNHRDKTILGWASDKSDPFGWLLTETDASEWSNWCKKKGAPWMSRVWLATASHVRAQHRFLHKSHGWGESMKALRLHPGEIRHADEYFLAQLRIATGSRRDDLLATPGLQGRLEMARQDGDEAFLRRFRRAKQIGPRVRRDVSKAERFLIQHWLEMPAGMPGMCFFGDSAIHALLEEFQLISGDVLGTKQVRVRLGLIQSGTKRHLVEAVRTSASTLYFTGSCRKMSWLLKGKFLWGEKQIWPRLP